MSTARITSLRLTAFKSYRGAVLPLAPLNVLIGRNGGGKSNALDALEVLSRLARGEEVRDALEGNRGDGPVRGGLDGCAPNGSDTFEIGATIEGDDGLRADLDVRIQVRPRVQVVSERLSADLGTRHLDLLATEAPDPDRSDLDASVWNGKRGRNPVLAFRSSHLLTSQLPLRFAGDTPGEQTLLNTATQVLGVLGGVFQLDPVPHLMRNYVPAQDYILHRTADNISASVARLKQEDPQRFGRLVQIIKQLPEQQVRALDIGKGPFGEVMVALKERKGRSTVTVPARQMSDGMLRMLAVATATLTGGGGLDLDRNSLATSPALLLVVEELENGLHPSLAAQVLELIKQSSSELGFQVVITSHSPALLNALSGDDHPGVILIDRDPSTALSRIRRLVDVPGYLGVMASQRLGDAVTTEQFARGPEAGAPSYDHLNRLLGIA